MTPITALGGSAPRIARFADMTLSENAGLALASLSMPRGAAPPAPFGLALPGPGRLVAAPPYGAFWMGPDSWMVSGEGLAETDFAAALAAEASGARITEQTDGFAAFDIAGPEAGIAALLERLVNLRPEAVAPGCGTRTGFEHMSVFILRPAPGRVTLLGMRSAAASVWHGLETTLGRL
nr:sarcosine oxidase subunit gamma [Mesobacterium pallidum]